MEEIGELYEKLNAAFEKEREELWKIIIEKNKILFNRRRDELNKILKNR